MAENKQHHYHDHTEDVLDKTLHLSLAHSATLHCLLGCGIGEVLGVIVGTALGLSNTITLLMAVVLGFVFGFILGMRPLLRAGFDFSRALRQVFIAESLSIAVMETSYPAHLQCDHDNDVACSPPSGLSQKLISLSHHVGREVIISLMYR